MVANIPNHLTDEAFVIWQLTVFDILSHDVTKQTAEIFVSWKG